MDQRTDHAWQVQEAKQRFSEVVRAAEAGAPQLITRRGQAVAVVVDIETYHRLTSDQPDFAAFLRSGPRFDDLPLERVAELTPVVELDED